MLILQGLGKPSIFLIALIATVMVIAIAITIYLLISWLGKPVNQYKRFGFAVVFACWLFYQNAFPTYVSSDALTKAAKTGVPSSLLIEKIGPPHSIVETSNAESMWYYETGFLANDIFGVTIDRNSRRVVDWYYQ
ncbi:hypothetical protein OAG71_03365 [bacterium]|nr:hypothetical protein [bacterium]